MRMIEMNKVFLTGRVTHDVELKHTKNNIAYLRLNIAVNKSYKDKTSGEWNSIVSFVPVSAFGKTAEYISKILQKGYAVYVEGNLKSSEYQDREGNKRKSLEVIADKITCLTKQNNSKEVAGTEGEYVPS